MATMDLATAALPRRATRRVRRSAVEDHDEHDANGIVEPAESTQFEETVPDPKVASTENSDEKANRQQEDSAFSTAVLEILNEIRHALRTAGLQSLPADFPILEEDLQGALGCAHTVHTEPEICEKDPHLRRYAKNRVESIGVRLRHEKSGERLPISSIIATALHEFAHCITPAEERQDIHNSSLGRRERAKWEFVGHPDAFYVHFAHVLQLSEKLNIFVLPSTKNKFGRQSLSRFDRIDADSSFAFPLATCPWVEERLMKDSDREKFAILQHHERERRKHSSLRVEVTAHKQGKLVIKVMVVDQRSFGDLEQEISRKFGAKVESIRLVDGTTITTDEDVWYMKNGTKLQVALQK